MSRNSATARRRGSNYPVNSWYVLATSDEVTREPLGRRALDLPIVLYRCLDGRVVALEDRCAHRPYPLSLGRLDGDTIVSGYTGFAYAPDGACIRVPTQTHVPYDARVRAFPVHEDASLVWVWLGEPALAGLRHPPRTPWLDDQGWATFGDQWDTRANFLLLHENFADITHVAVVDPYISPPVLRAAPPPLEVEVTETTVSFHRSYAPAPIASWHADVLGLPAEAEHAQREEGAFVSPGLWVNRWDVQVASDGRAPGDFPEQVATHTFRFTHAVTPMAASLTRHVWRVSRNFAPGQATTERLAPIFTAYYRRVQAIMETMQSVVDIDGPREEVRVSADAAALQVRKIIGRLVADERSG